MSNPNSTEIDEYDIQEIVEQTPYAKTATTFINYVLQKNQIQVNADEKDIAYIHIIRLMKHLKREEKSFLNDLKRMQ